MVCLWRTATGETNLHLSLPLNIFFHTSHSSSLSIRSSSPMRMNSQPLRMHRYFPVYFCLLGQLKPIPLLSKKTFSHVFCLSPCYYPFVQPAKSPKPTVVEPLDRFHGNHITRSCANSTSAKRPLTETKLDTEPPDLSREQRYFRQSQRLLLTASTMSACRLCTTVGRNNDMHSDSRSLDQCWLITNWYHSLAREVFITQDVDHFVIILDGSQRRMLVNKPLPLQKLKMTNLEHDILSKLPQKCQSST